MVDITHLYFGTAGAAGLYSHRIYRALEKDFNQDCIVNYYFPFDYGQRYFFRITELSGPNVFGSWKYFRFFIRYFELLIGLLRSTILLATNGSKVVNYNLISQHNTEYIFLKFWKRFLKKKIVLTLHDVVPFAPQYRSLFPASNAKQKIIDLADYIVVHNQNSIDDFVQSFKFDGTLFRHSFPIMDLKELFGSPEGKSRDGNQAEPYKFLFVGHPRIEKGLDVLVDAWQLIDAEQLNCKLIVASNIDKGSQIYGRLCSLKNVEILPKFLSDKLYFELIASSDCVVLPYKRGTNSGIPGSVLSLGVNVICSNIPMFKNNSLVPKDSFFEVGDPVALANKMVETLKMKNDNFEFADELAENVKRYDDMFSQEIVSLYRELI